MTSGKAIFGACTIAIAAFFFWPSVIGSWQEMQALRAARNEREALLKDRTDILARATEQYASYQAALAGEGGRALFSMVPAKKDTAELVSAIQDIAARSGAQIGEIRTADSKGKTSDPYRTLTLTIELSGSYSALRSFLSGLEQYVRVMSVESIEVSTDTRAPGSLRFGIRADTYFIQ
ncbi:MAG: type 4a pilus biogenesis protein PilO [Candidatus Yanofskybacteria bacterium]|nr:type 4a pilus biogenesis protein PilO [Candidatus Yanofskybacteria bacterium]